MNKATHLYVHLPFCIRRCAYCDFYSETGALGHAGPYVGALLGELEEFNGVLGRLETVYLGGGTPTLIGAELLEELLGAVTARAASGAEITVEANPATVTRELARRLKSAGVTRMSLGVQSFSSRLRENLGRAGEAAAVEKAVAWLREAGFGNIGLDMIFGIPGQGMDDLRRDIESVLALEPEHISYYELTAKEGSAFRVKWELQLAALEPEGRLFYETVVDALEGAGYRWYETSNFARPGNECRHNQAYWNGADYIGLGAGSWSTAGMDRWRNVEGIEEYIRAAGRDERRDLLEKLTADDKMCERLALGLRTAGGTETSRILPVLDVAQQNYLLANGFITCDGDKISLTRAGRFMANEVCARLIKG